MDARFQPVIARLFAFIGPHLPLDAQFAAGNFIRDAVNAGPIKIAGDGTPYRSYLYAADLAVWLWTTLMKAAPGRAYNVGSSEAVSILDLAERIAGAAGGVQIQIARHAGAGVTPERYVPATRRAEQELGVRVAVSLDDAIERTLAWHRSRAAA
jgi:dTDP-glucose 4,6-dehydratase